MNGPREEPSPEQIKEALQYADGKFEHLTPNVYCRNLAAALRSSQAKLGTAHACDYFSEPNHTPSSRLCRDCGKVVDAFRSEINEAEKERDPLAEKLREAEKKADGMDRGWGQQLRYTAEEMERARIAEQQRDALAGRLAAFVKVVQVHDCAVGKLGSEDGTCLTCKAIEEYRKP